MTAGDEVLVTGPKWHRLVAARNRHLGRALKEIQCAGPF